MLTKLFSNNSLSALVMALFVALLFGLLLGNFYLKADWVIYGKLFSPVTWLSFFTLLLLLPLSVWLFDLQLKRATLLPPSNFIIVTLAGVSTIVLLLANQPDFILLMLLLALGFGRLMQLAQSANSYWVLTDVGLFIGIGMCVNAHLIWLILFSWLAALFFGVLTVRSFFAPLIGAGLSYILIASTTYFSTNFFPIPEFNWQFTDFAFFVGFTERWWMLIPLVLGIIATLTTTLGSLNKGKVTDRQSFGFLLVTFLLAAILNLFLRNSIVLGLMLCFPLAVFYANFLQRTEKWWLKDLVLISPWVTLCLLLFF